MPCPPRLHTTPLQMTAKHSGASGVSRRSTSSRAGSAPVDLARMWEVRFKDLEIVEPVGEGSFGRVYL